MISKTNIAQVEKVKVTFSDYFNKRPKKSIKPSTKANINSAYIKYSIDDPKIECLYAVSYICLKQPFDDRLESGVLGKKSISFLSFYLLLIRYHPNINQKDCLKSVKVDVTNTLPEQLIIILITIWVDYSKREEIDL